MMLKPSFLELLTAVGLSGRDNRGGYATQGDVLVNKSADKIDLNVIWDTITAATTEYNKQRSALTSILSFWTTDTGDAIPQGIVQVAMEEASEFGVPTSVRTPTALPLGYRLKDFDRRDSFTWRYLRSATA